MFNIFNPLSDMINRILVSQKKKLKYVFLCFSKFLFSILSIIKFEGYISNIFIFFFNFNFIIVELKYFNNKPLINHFKNVQKFNISIYKNYKTLPCFMNNLGCVIVSTNYGVINSKLCKTLGVGGKLICYVF